MLGCSLDTVRAGRPQGLVPVQSQPCVMVSVWAVPCCLPAGPGRWGCEVPGTCDALSGRWQFGSCSVSCVPSCISQGVGVLPFLGPCAAVCVPGPTLATRCLLLVTETDSDRRQGVQPCRLSGTRVRGARAQGRGEWNGGPGSPGHGPRGSISSWWELTSVCKGHTEGSED